jgi:hypothetical protein
MTQKANRCRNPGLRLLAAAGIKPYLQRQAAQTRRTTSGGSYTDVYRRRLLRTTSAKHCTSQQKLSYVNSKRRSSLRPGCSVTVAGGTRAPAFRLADR